MNATQTLLSPAELSDRLEDARLVLLDCRFQLGAPHAGRAAYREEHLPGAIYADLEKDLSGPITEATGRHPLPAPDAFEETLRRWGVTDQSWLVAYDGRLEGFAARAWWMARWAGLDRCWVLDGGFQAWQAAGFPTTDRVPSPSPSDYRLEPNRSCLVSTEDLRQRLGRGDVTLIDARDAVRFRGEVEPIDPIAGHVPGAKNLPHQQNIDGDGRYFDASRLRQRFAPLIGDGNPEEVVHMCGSGVTACNNLLAMEHAGLRGSKLYVGSWSEWIRQPDAPIELGVS